MTAEILTGKRWALQWPPIPNASPMVRHFWTTTDRNAWVAEAPRQREAVGVRNSHVKAYRTSKASEARFPIAQKVKL